MGRTHGVHAEPTTFGVKMALWYTEMKRNLKRFKEVRKEIEVGKMSGYQLVHLLTFLLK